MKPAPPVTNRRISAGTFRARECWGPVVWCTDTPKSVTDGEQPGPASVRVTLHRRFGRGDYFRQHLGTVERLRVKRSPADAGRHEGWGVRRWTQRWARQWTRS